jgi:hypothetical protein
MLMSMILSVGILLPTTIISGFQTSVLSNASGQFMIDSANEGNSSAALDTGNNNTNTSDNNMTDDNIVATSTITATSNSSAAPSNDTTRTSPTITVKDIVNSTYIASKDDDEDSSERRIARAIRDRVNDLLHTVVSTNATIISTATITNDFLREVTIINNNTRLLEEVLPAQLGVALDRIRAIGSISQPVNSVNSMLELHTDIEMMCIANSTSLANCDISMRIR